ncbi:hypothetical protein BOX15_Mlig004527g1, partial [Macrostomum lignano]
SQVAHLLTSSSMYNMNNPYGMPPPQHMGMPPPPPPHQMPQMQMPPMMMQHQQQQHQQQYMPPMPPMHMAYQQMMQQQPQHHMMAPPPVQSPMSMAGFPMQMQQPPMSMPMSTMPTQMQMPPPGQMSMPAMPMSVPPPGQPIMHQMQQQRPMPPTSMPPPPMQFPTQSQSSQQQQQQTPGSQQQNPSYQQQLSSSSMPSTLQSSQQVSIPSVVADSAAAATVASPIAVAMETQQQQRQNQQIPSPPPSPTSILATDHVSASQTTQQYIQQSIFKSYSPDFRTVLKELHPPTAVTHCLYCRLMSPRDQQLLVFSGHLLRVYRLVEAGTDELGANADASHNSSGGAALDFVYGVEFYSPVLDALALPATCLDKRDSLLLAFEEAKLSVVEFDDSTRELRATSLHTYEDVKYKDARRQFTRPPMLRLDPQRSCVVMLVYDKHLAVLPLRRQLVGVPELDAKPAVLPSYVLPLWDQAEAIVNVADVQFLNGYYDPTVCVLHEPIGTWSGRVTARHDTYRITAMSLNPKDRTNPIIWSQAGLPFDCFALLPVPKPIGGLVVLARNSVIYLNQSQRPTGLALNSNINNSTSFPLRRVYPPTPRLSLDGGKAIFLPNTGGRQFLVGVRDGSFYVFTLYIDSDMRQLNGFHWEPVGKSSPLSCFAMLTAMEAETAGLTIGANPADVTDSGGMLFVGSFVSDSELVRLVGTGPMPTPVQFTNGDASAAAAAPTAPATPPPPPSPPTIDDDDDNENVEEDDDMRDNSKATEHNDEDEGDGDANEEPQNPQTDEADVEIKQEEEDNHSEATVAKRRRLESSFSNTSLVSPPPHTSAAQDQDESVDKPTVNPADSLNEDSQQAPPSLMSQSSVTPSEQQQQQEEPPQQPLGVPQVSDPELDEIYETEEAASQSDPTKRFQLDRCDYLPNVGPIGELTAAYIQGMFDNFLVKESANLELLTSYGHAEHGGINLLQRSVRPLIHSSFEIPDCSSLWSLYGDRRRPWQFESNAEEDEECEGHGYLVLSREETSLVFQVTDEIAELEDSGFSTSEPTLWAADVGDDLSLQVCPSSVRLLRGSQQVLVQPLEERARLVTVCDPFVLIVDETDGFLLLEVIGETLRTERPTVQQYSFATAIAITDHPFLRLHRKPTAADDGAADFADSAATAAAATFDPLEEEDVLLYGDALSERARRPAAPPPPPTYDSDCQTTHWAIVCYESGALEIYQLPDFVCCFAAKAFSDGPRLVTDASLFAATQVGAGGIDTATGASLPTAAAADDDVPPEVEELSLMPIGRHLDRLLLLCRSRDEVSAYEAYPAPASDVAALPPGRLAVRLRRLDDLGVLLRTGKKPSKQRRTGKQQQQQQLLLQQQSELQQQLHGKHARLLVPFEDIGGYRGLFVGGVRPHFLVVSPSGQAYSHPMFVDGSVCAFSPFDRHFCRHGFLYLTPERDLRVASLPDDYDYASPWPRKRVPLGRTVHCVQFHRATSTYLVASSAPELSNAICRLSSDGDKEIDTREVPPTHCLPFRDRYYFEAYTPDWQAIPAVRLDMQVWERVACCRIVRLQSEETAEGFKELVAVATNLSYNEEITCKGTITLLDVINVVPEPGQPLTAYKMKLAFREEQKGPVTALASCHGLLVSAIGQKVYLWQLKDDRLVGIAFVDSEILIHSINCVKNLIVTSDLAKSVQLLRYQPSVRVLSIVARDSARRQVFTSNFLVDGQNLGFLLCDSRRNLLAFAYDPSEKLSRGGRNLVRKREARLPSSVHCSLRVHNCLRGGAGLAKTRDIQQGHSVVMGTAEGGLYLLTPVRRPVYTRLIMLEKHLSHAVLHPAGLHPRASRIYSPANHDLEPAKSGIIDGHLMYRYVSLGHSERVEVAKKAGLSADAILDDLAEIQVSTLHF